MAGDRPKTAFFREVAQSRKKLAKVDVKHANSLQSETRRDLSLGSKPVFFRLDGGLRLPRAEGSDQANWAEAERGILQLEGTFAHKTRFQATLGRYWNTVVMFGVLCASFELLKWHSRQNCAVEGAWVDA